MITTDIITHCELQLITVPKQTRTMKFVIVLCCVAVAVLADEKYTSKYDDVNVDEVLENPRLLKGYVDCVMERGKCTSEGKELRDHMKDAIATGCSKCTEAQEKGATKVIDHLIKNEPAIWRELCAKYDPEGKWRKKYEDRARANGIVIPEE
ncbi:allergen Tha p 1-like [Anticarsia gemmatalis]|uniref:allergen Tha p 1-like n=1 Tax=Anticarsia gemmatalis TaxID=129554 RepID=UPI003F76E5C5